MLHIWEKWISEKSATAFSEFFDYDQIVAQFPDASPNEILEAVGELELEDMVVVNKCYGKPFSHLSIKHKLFETFDPIVFDGVSPRQDASVIAETLLQSDNGISASNVCDEQGWTPRRFNPAVEIAPICEHGERKQLDRRSLGGYLPPNPRGYFKNGNRRVREIMHFTPFLT